jgi:hypothetical protein
VLLPFSRNRLRERNAIDAAEELAEARRRSPSERLEQTLELSNLVRELARATGADRLADEHADLEEKARLYAEPLRVLMRGR